MVRGVRAPAREERRTVCTRAAATEESTPPESAQMTLPLVAVAAASARCHLRRRLDSQGLGQDLPSVVVILQRVPQEFGIALASKDGSHPPHQR